jgi:FxsC-like protein
MTSFFYSYARADRDLDPEGNIERFFGDLDRWVQTLQSRGSSPGFFDTHGINAGDDWPVRLREALSTSRILVPMYSPRYVTSDYCRWEWRTFYAPYAAARHRGQAQPSCIVPVKWLTPVTLPHDYEQFSYSHEDFPEVYRRNDLRQLMSSRKYRDAYNGFVRTFATQLVAKIDQFGADPSRSVSPLPEEGLHSGAGVPGIAETGSRYVRFVFVAGLRHEIVDPRNFRDCYGLDPERRDWRPCYPSRDRRIAEIIEEVAEAEGRVVRYLAPGQPLIPALRQAEEDNNLVIIVVDPWSTNIQALKDFIDDFDRVLIENCGVVIVWNQEDPETSYGRPLFDVAIKRGFRRHLELTNMFFRESVSSIEELQQALVDAFLKIRGNIVAEGRAADVPDGLAKEKPTVSI